jgi:HEAT repeat protein
MDRDVANVCESGEPGERRRRAALAGHQGNAAAARVFLSDDDPATRAAALTSLARLGDLAVTELTAALTDRSSVVRMRAARLAAGHPEVPLLALLADGDPAVVGMAAWALGERPAAPEVTSALVTTASTHRDPLCREAAVAALGALGDEAGLPAILAALGDKPPVRRRAVLALAPFEGPEVSAALERALEDRDWQVRQAAEDLLG